MLLIYMLTPSNSSKTWTNFPFKNCLGPPQVLSSSDKLYELQSYYFIVLSPLLGTDFEFQPDMSVDFLLLDFKCIRGCYVKFTLYKCFYSILFYSIYRSQVQTADLRSGRLIC